MRGIFGRRRGGSGKRGTPPAGAPSDEGPGSAGNMAKRAFTLIELLVVIAIIGILAAIIFPVFAQVKLSGYRSSDISNMNQIRTALLQYRTDQGGVPPALLGYITPYEYANGATVVPAEQYFGPLYPKRVNSLSILRPALVRTPSTLMVPAVWPQADDRALGTAPIVDTNGDGKIDAADDIAGARQAYSSNYAGGTINYFTNDRRNTPSVGSSTDPAETTVGRFYAVSGYDVGLVKTPKNGDVYELHYAPFWTQYGVNDGSGLDDPRQLGYNDPPESTVVTWNSTFRDYDSNRNPVAGKKEIVLFLGGSARPFDPAITARRAWRAMP